jgi:uncharacterized protein (TIGR03382 family)
MTSARSAAPVAALLLVAAALFFAATSALAGNDQNLDPWAYNVLHPAAPATGSPTTAAAFQWGDAGAGAGVTLALLLAVAGGVLLLRRRGILVRAHVPHH